MTSPRFWSDPLNGATYNFGQRLTSTQMNAYVAGLRNVDAALEYQQALNWNSGKFSTPLSTLQSNVVCTYDNTTGELILVSKSAGSTYAQVAGTGLTNIGYGLVDNTAQVTPLCISSYGGTTLIGGTDTAGLYEKVMKNSASGWAAQSLTVSGTSSVQALAYEQSNSIWVAGLDGWTTTTNIETSPDGETWTQRTNANGNPIKDIATDNAGTIVAVSSKVTNKAVRSTDGVSWSEVTLPSSADWKAIAYLKGVGKWFASSSGSDAYASSTDGITWNSETVTYAGEMGKTGGYAQVSSYPHRLGASNNVLFAYCEDKIFMSTDGTTMKPVSAPTAEKYTDSIIDSRELWVGNGCAISVANVTGSTAYYVSSSLAFHL